MFVFIIVSKSSAVKRFVSIICVSVIVLQVDLSLICQAFGIGTN